MREADIGWLAGIIDGEGCLSVRTHKDGVGYSVYLTVTNCSMVLLQKLVRLLRENGAPSTSKVRSKHIPDNPRWSTKWQATLTKRDELMVILRLVVPHLTEKKAFAEAVLDFYHKKQWNSRWTDEQIQEMLEIKELYTGRRTTVRDDPTLRGDAER